MEKKTTVEKAVREIRCFSGIQPRFAGRSAIERPIIDLKTCDQAPPGGMMERRGAINSWHLICVLCHDTRVEKRPLRGIGANEPYLVYKVRLDRGAPWGIDDPSEFNRRNRLPAYAQLRE